MNLYESIKENLNESGWMTFQTRIEDTLEEAKNTLDEDRFNEFCEGVINLCQNYLGELDQYDIQDSEKKEIKEAQLIVPESTDDGWGEDIRDLTTDFFDLTDQVDYEIKNARRGSYGIDGTEVSDLVKVFNDISDKASEISDILDKAEINYSSDEDEEEED